MSLPKLSRRCLCSRRMKIAYVVIFGLPLLAFLVILGICLGNAVGAKKPGWLADLGADQDGVDFLPDDIASGGVRLERFRDALRFETISAGNGTTTGKTAQELAKLLAYIRKAYPLMHNSPNVDVEHLGAPGEPFSLLYRVRTTQNSSRANKASTLPYLLMAHLDVVPVQEEYWQHKPFGAEVEDGFVYGRGAIDNKNNAMSILEALEYKLATGKPIKRTLYVALGHDEEVRGSRGQKFIAKFLREEWAVNKFSFILDEGLCVVELLIPGVPGPIALIGVTEKGQASVDLSITGMNGGHSSNPPSESTIDVLAKAIINVRSNPQPRSFGPGAPEYIMLETLAPYANFMYKLIYSNLWLLSGVVARQFESKRVTNAAIRTTTAFTIIEGGIKVNVMPASAKATINHRIHYSQTVGGVVRHDREAVGDSRVQVVLLNGSYPAHPVSPFGADTPYYKLIAKSVLQIYPGIPVGPGTLIANTDTRWYLNFTKNIYRFSAVRLDVADITRLHGHDERISVESYLNINDFYYRLMQNAEEDVF